MDSGTILRPGSFRTEPAVCTEEASPADEAKACVTAESEPWLSLRALLYNSVFYHSDSLLNCIFTMKMDRVVSPQFLSHSDFFKLSPKFKHIQLNLSVSFLALTYATHSCPFHCHP